MRLRNAAVSIVMLVLAAYGQQRVWMKEADGFKGVRFFSSEDDAKKVVTFQSCDPQSANTTSCVMMFDVTDRWAIRANFLFVNHQLRSVEGSFPSDGFEDIKDAFRYKYGAPTGDVTSNIQLKTGPTFEQETLTWVGSTVLLTLHKYADTVDEGDFVFVLKRDADDEAARIDAMKRKALD